MTTDYPSFPKIPRLSKPVTITEKIDGTNGLVFVGEDGTVRAGSRNRWLDPDQPDNHGFRAWVEANADDLRTLGHGHHYGEWWGDGVNKRYKGTPKRFSLFNTARYTETRPACCGVVPVLAELPTIDTNAVAEILRSLKEGGSVAAPGCMNPEGIIVFHSAHGNLFKVLLEDDGGYKGARQ
jgi:hypothetical protein